MPPLPAREPTAELHLVTHPELGMLLVVGEEDGQRRLLNFGPAANAGSQHRIRIERAHLWPDRVQAIVEASLLPDSANGEGDEIPIAFHDWAFAVNRGFYEVGKVNDFILCAFAASVRPSPGSEIRIPRPAWADQLGIDAGMDPITVDTSEFAVWLKRPEAGLATYEFRGQVISIRPMLGTHREEVFGVRFKRVRTRVLREPDIDLDIFISDAVADDLDFLQPGAWIEGIATMSGHCWF
jgi:hypothetical protein